MKLYAGSNCLYGHACRIVLKEKDVDCDVLDPAADPEFDLTELNPYGESPTLIDRELVLYGDNVITEFLDERLPHPPLMPLDPIGRGRARLLVARLQRDWLNEVKRLLDEGKPLNKKLKKSLWDGLLAMSPIFLAQRYAMGNEFSLVDCYLAPLLWRLSAMDVTLPRQGQAVMDYSERLFERSTFQASLNSLERDMNT
ncbi:MAG TPA: stringent starvation protein A [Gammaproteobacteria bacterium]|jgi:RNA polymerase-associated protein|nr:glutathione S-transferase N-terminal domain-containing protein [Arenicellales bacterium]HIG13125.1 stringent starvation protein A [Gammaproteobacteria bacterium]HIL18658.1 stringent starvation protein A [Gammaproteobacteria bacterium]|tara:strand:+ start:417 stop:1010 length:594 start_codon:yes stop_codon:yes gene_type:complete